jgi:hypothetical protein
MPVRFPSTAVDRVKVFVGSGLAGSAHVIIDIVGYYM